MPLTTDEVTVLMIAAQGESLMAIGRWERPVRDLTARGLLHANDAHNYVITLAGKQEIETYTQEMNQQLREVLHLGNKIATNRKKIDKSLEKSAIHLYMAIKIAAEMPGYTREVATSRLLELLKMRVEQME